MLAPVEVRKISKQKAEEKALALLRRVGLEHKLLLILTNCPAASSSVLLCTCPCDEP